MGPIWTIFKRGLGTHKVMNITWETFLRNSNNINRHKVFGCECWIVTLRDMQLTINEHKLFQTCNAQRWPTETKQP